MYTDLALIPRGLKSVLQPPDLSVKNLFKNNVRKLYMECMAEDGHELTLTGKIRRPSNETMSEWIAQVWNMVLRKIITKGFLKTGITNCLNRSEDEMLWVEDENVDVKGNGESASEGR
jgi:hypothetical protein